MRQAEAAKLKPGDRVVVEDAYGASREAVVIHATKRGGVKVDVDGGEAWAAYPYVHWPDDAEFVRRVSKALFKFKK